MPTLITTQVQKWNGRLIKKGVRIEATSQEARVLLALGRAKPAEETVKAVVAQPAVVAEDAAKQKRAYKRRDIAESPEQAVVTPEPKRWTWPQAKSED